MTITIPPLRSRKEDIPLLIKNMSRHILQSNDGEHIHFDKECTDALISYYWPGNVKQLETVIENAIYASQNSIIQLSHLPIDIVNDYYTKKNQTKTLYDFQQEETEILSEKTQEYNELLFAIKEAHGDVKKASEILYIPTSTLYRKLNKYHIHPKSFKKQ